MNLGSFAAPQVASRQMSAAGSTSWPRRLQGFSISPRTDVFQSRARFSKSSWMNEMMSNVIEIQIKSGQDSCLESHRFEFRPFQIGAELLDSSRMLIHVGEGIVISKLLRSKLNLEHVSLHFCYGLYSFFFSQLPLYQVLWSTFLEHKYWRWRPNSNFSHYSLSSGKNKFLTSMPRKNPLRASRW